MNLNPYPLENIFKCYTTGFKIIIINRASNACYEDNFKLQYQDVCTLAYVGQVC